MKDLQFCPLDVYREKGLKMVRFFRDQIKELWINKVINTDIFKTCCSKFIPNSAKMTRQKWTTPEQEAWLDKRKPAFLEANQKKSAGKEFFPDVTKAFCEKWPAAPPTQQEINDAGSIELAIRVKQGKYDKVCSYHS